jgi:DNA-directed RNA polymerase subunit RPC12/RpoP
MEENYTRKFTKLDNSFICQNCGKEVSQLGYTSRDHCPHCLYSLHVDINPGDRACKCKALLKPIGIEKNKKGYQIVYRCTKCGEQKKNIVAQDDSYSKILKLSSGEDI